MPRVVTPQLLEAVKKGFKTNFQKGFAGVTALYTSLCTVVPSTSSEETYGWLGDIPKMREWFGDRQMHGLRSHGYAIKNRKFELTVSVMFAYRPYFGEAAPGQVLPSVWSHGSATAEIRAAVDGLVDAAPGDLDALNELVAALGMTRWAPCWT